MNRFIFLSIFTLCSLSSTVLSAQNWQTDWEKTKLESKQTNKKIVLVFSGSDWCIPCIKLEKKIWISYVKCMEIIKRWLRTQNSEKFLMTCI